VPVDVYRFKPKGTSWIGVEVIVQYSCKAEPKVERVRISGVKQFGFIVSHEYDIDAFVDTSRRIGCEEQLSSCSNPRRYSFTVKCLLSGVVGFGLGIGKVGTGTAGWRSRTEEQQLSFQTRCICCDDEVEQAPAIVYLRIEPSESTRSATALILGLTALGLGLTASILNFDHPSLLPKLFVYGTGSATLAAAVVTLRRLVTFWRGRQTDEKKDRSDQSKLPV
jgi:hypothetical protein